MRASHLLLRIWVALPLACGQAHAVTPEVCLELLQGAESAVEIELSFTPEVAQLFTTTDGTIGPVLSKPDGSRLPAPDWLPHWIEANAPQYTARVYTLPWEVLDSRLQRALIAYTAKKNHQNFWITRRIRGLKIKPILTFFTPSATQLFGQTFQSGETASFVTQGSFLPYIEFRSPEDLHTSAQGVEVHIRSAMPAGELLRKASELLSLIGLGPKKVHIHLPFRLPQFGLLRNRPIKIDLRAYFNPLTVMEVEFFRRLNMLTELAEFMEAGGQNRVYTVNEVASVVASASGEMKTERFTNYGPLFDQGLAKLVIEMSLRVEFPDYSDHPPGVQPLRNALKIAAVGFRDQGTYDQPEMYGYEFRKADPMLGTRFYENLLNQVWLRRLTGNLGISEKEIFAAPFFHARDPMRVYYSDHSIHFEKTQDQHTMNLLLRRLLPSYPWSWFLNERAKDHLEFDYLTHDWSRDMLTLFSGAELVRVQGLQVQALRALQHGQDPAAVVKDFIDRSGIYSRLKQGLLE